jgi:RNA 3'-terminal phosphate cyclase
MTLQFDGCAYFRQRLVLSTLSCTPIKIKNIRSQENEPGLRSKKKFSFSYIYFHVLL